MTDERDLRPDHEMDGRVSTWLTDTDLSPDEANAGLERLLQEFPVTPQARRRFLGRWLDRDEGVGRHAADHDPPPNTNRRNRLMLSATGITAALAILAITASVIDPSPAPFGQAGAATLTVAPDGEYDTIQAALDAASDGDTILIGPGTYTEAVVIDKDLTISGDGDREDIVITAPEDGPSWPVDFAWIRSLPYAIVVDGADVTLEGMTFRGKPSRVLFDGGESSAEGLYLDGVGVTYDGGTNTTVTGGIVVNGDTAVTLRRNTLDGGGEIYVFGYSEAVVEDNELIDGPTIAGLFGSQSVVSGNRITGPGFQGIVFLGGTNAAFTDNIIEERERAIGVGVGLSTGADHAPIIERNEIRAAGKAIDLITATGGRVVDNTVQGAEIGIVLGARDILVDGNTVGAATTGIWVSGPATLQHNHVEGNMTGITVTAGASPTLQGNVVCGNETNLSLLGGADPVLEDNEICEDAPAE